MLLEVNHIWFQMLLEESITCVRISLALHQMLHIWDICKKQGVRSTNLWKPRLRNCKSHIKKNVHSCNIATHFIDECCDEIFSIRWLAFVIIDMVNNPSGLTRNQREELLLGKEKFWFGNVVTQHQGLNSNHDWNH